MKSVEETPLITPTSTGDGVGGGARKIYLPLDSLMVYMEKKFMVDERARQLRFHIVFLAVLLAYIFVYQDFRNRSILITNIRSNVEYQEFQEIDSTQFTSTLSASQLINLSISDSLPSTDNKRFFYQVDSPQSYWSWFYQIIIKKEMQRQFCSLSSVYKNTGIFASYMFNSSDRDFALQAESSFCSDMLSSSSIMLYGIAIRQSRVMPTAVSFGSVVYDQYPNYQESTEDMTFYGAYTPNSVVNGPVTGQAFPTQLYFWQESILEQPYHGSLTTYSPNGYQVVFPTFHSCIFNNMYKFMYYAFGGLYMQDLPGGVVNQTFINEGTRMIVSEAVFYGPAVDMFVAVQFVNEISELGEWISYSNYYTAPTTNAQTTGSGLTGRIVTAVFLLAMIICYFVLLVRGFRIRNLNLWIVVMCAQVILLGFAVSFIAQTLFFSEELLVIPDPNVPNVNVEDPLWICNSSTMTPYGPCSYQPAYYRNVVEYCIWYSTYTIVFGYIVALECIILMRYVFQYEVCGSMKRGIIAAQWDIFVFMFLFAVEMTGFAAAGSVYFLMSFGNTYTYLLVGYLLFSTDATPETLSGYWFKPIYYMLFGAVFLLVFRAVNLAIMFFRYGTEVQLDFEKREKQHALSLKWLRTTLWHPVYSAKSSSYRKRLRNFFRDPKARTEEMEYFCHFWLHFSIHGWLSRETLFQNVCKYKAHARASADPLKFFILINDQRLGREVLGGGKVTLPHCQFEAYVYELDDYLLTKMEVDAKVASMEFQRDQYGDEEQKANATKTCIRPGELQGSIERLRGNHSRIFEYIDRTFTSMSILQDQLHNQMVSLKGRLSNSSNARQ